MLIAAIDRLIHHSIIFDMAGTQSWCSTRTCRSMPTPSACIAIPSTGARFGSLENRLVLNAALSNESRRIQMLRHNGLRHIRDIGKHAAIYIW
jgi:hypothetical protein